MRFKNGYLISTLANTDVAIRLLSRLRLSTASRDSPGIIPIKFRPTSSRHPSIGLREIYIFDIFLMKSLTKLKDFLNFIKIKNSNFEYFLARIQVVVLDNPFLPSNLIHFQVQKFFRFQSTPTSTPQRWKYLDHQKVRKEQV